MLQRPLIWLLLLCAALSIDSEDDLGLNETNSSGNGIISEKEFKQETGQELESLVNAVEESIVGSSTVNSPNSTIESSFSDTDVVKNEAEVEPDDKINETNVENVTKLKENVTLSNVKYESIDSGHLDLNESSNDNATENGDEDSVPNFLSFDEWMQKKALANAKSGNSVVNKKTIDRGSRNREGYYSVGEENEIDFDLFASSKQEKFSEDYKNRFNFASLDCAATIVKTNPGAKGASSVLLESKDSYLLNECNFKEKLFIIELCEDILIDTIMMGNYEFFSSIFKTVEFSVSDRYPVASSEWKVLGEFEAKNVRDIQSFAIENPLIWARYLKVEIKSHYGSEFYCPVSIVRVHGRTMMEEYKLREAGEKLDEKRLKVAEAQSEEEELTGKGLEFEYDDNTGSHATNADFSAEIDNIDGSRSAGVHSSNSNSLPSIDEPVSTDTDGNNSSPTQYANTICSDKKIYNEFESFINELKKNESCEPEYLLDSSKKMSLSKNSSATFKSTLPIASKRSEPTTQESIYKNIMKRLSLLESNASLSLLYIEEQSKLLTEAFNKLEKRQSNKFTLLVYAINETFQSQMNDFKSTFQVFKSDSQKLLIEQEEMNQKTYGKIDRNFSRLSNELQFQKKIVLLLFVIVVCLLVYVILTRDTFIEGEYFDEVLDQEVARYRGGLSADNSVTSFVDDARSDFSGDNSNLELASPQFNLYGTPISGSSPSLDLPNNAKDFNGNTSPTSPSMKRRLKFRFTNKFGGKSSSTLLLDNSNLYNHRKTPSNASSVISGSNLASESGQAKLNSQLKEVTNTKEQYLEKNLLTPDHSDDDAEPDNSEDEKP